MSFVTPAEVVANLRLRDRMVLADLGTGSGAYVFALAERLRAEHIQNATIYAVDVQKSLLERLRLEISRRGYANVETLWADIDLPGGVKLADNVCDAAVVSNVLFQTDNKEAFAKEAVRILKPGGQLLVIDWSLPGQAGGSFEHMGPGPEQMVSLSDGRTLFTKLGLSVAREFDAGSHHWGILFSKS